ncbi:hypothetical protein J8J27_30685, partial [Mycobacterium tuberculosis]|nr:hypothetical protein [Mycobacterium tuberculosis]
LFHFGRNLFGLALYSSGFGGIRYNALPIAVLVGAIAAAWWAGRLTLARTALPALGLMLLASLAVPSQVFGGAGVHVRLPAIVAVLL